MTSHEVDPIIGALAEPELLRRKAAARYRYRRPVVDVFNPPGTTRDEDRIVDANTTDRVVYDILATRSISPRHSRPLMEQLVKLLKVDVPNYQAIDDSREEKAKLIRANIAKSSRTTVDQQG